MVSRPFPLQCQLFIADLHLRPAAPNHDNRTLELALGFFEQARSASHLYILGDLFEYWLGDDIGLAAYAPVIESLKALSDSGCQLTLMHGNRDFLLGEAFARHCGATLIQHDEYVMTCGSERVLLMHGDTLCIDDHAYQDFRRQVRDESWQTHFVALPAEERLHQARLMREQSSTQSAQKTLDIMDVNTGCVVERLQANDCRVVVHGHTHRPQVHLLEPPLQQRLVVGDWHPSHCMYGVYDGKALQLERFGAL